MVAKFNTKTHFQNTFSFFELCIEFCVLWYPYWIFAKNCFPYINSFCLLLSQKQTKGMKKILTNIFFNVSYLSILHPLPVWEASFCQKKFKSLYPTIQYHDVRGSVNNWSYQLMLERILRRFLLEVISYWRWEEGRRDTLDSRGTSCRGCNIHIVKQVI